MFIGFYNLANFITLAGLMSSILACFSAVKAYGETPNMKLLIIATLLFLLSGLCDMCDGRIARGKFGRTRKEKLFGIQIDSLCDMVSFGVTPCVIAYCAGLDKFYHIIIYIIYAACGAIRLAYFNTQAVEDTPDLNMHFFTGVPIPVCCLTLPPMMLIYKLWENTIAVSIIFASIFLITGIAFILNIRIKKMDMTKSLIVVLFELICVVLLVITKQPV